MTNRIVSCANCGESLDPTNMPHLCPKCGSESKNVSITAHDVLKVTLCEKVKVTTIREFYEKNHKALAVVITISIISPFVGLFILGPLGVIAGLVLGLISFLLGPSAVTKVREIKEKST